MAVQAAQVGSGLEKLVERIESLAPTEMEEGYAPLREQAGSVRHLTVASLVASARSLDWAPSDLAGSFDLTPATARHVETLMDRLPQGGRERIARLYALAVAHRIHQAGENAPYLLPEIAPDPERMKDPAATFAEMRAALTEGATIRALHAWPCCHARTPWSQVTEAIAALALADGATFGARAVAAASIRRFLEITGREHRHPVVTALLRALAVAPRGEDPAPRHELALAGVTDPDRHRTPGEGHPARPRELAALLVESSDPDVAIGGRIVAGDSLESLFESLALAACERFLALEDAPPALEAWVGDTLVAVNAMRDLDGLETGALRPRVVVEAARVFAARTAVACQRGARWGSWLPVISSGVATVESMRQALAAGDRRLCAALASALAASPQHAAEAVQVLDSTAPFDPRDLTGLRVHVAATDEYRRTGGPAAERFLAAAARGATLPA